MRRHKSKSKVSTSKSKQREIPKKHEIVIDESGFITNPDLWLEEKPKENNLRKRHVKPLRRKESPKQTDERDFVAHPDLKSEENPEGVFQRIHSEELQLPAKKFSKKTEIYSRIPIVKQEPIDNFDSTKKRINPFYKIKCPICDKEYFYRLLFEHVSTKHPEYNPKIILSRINRKLRGET